MSFDVINQVIGASFAVKNYLDNKSAAIIKPKSAEGVSGFVFDIPDNEKLNLDSDITDHYTESNNFINDHITKKPIVITLSGFIGELVYRGPEGIAGDIQEINNRLETVEAYLGDYTPGGLQAAQRIIQQTQTAVSAINQLEGKIKNVVGLFDGVEPGDTLQQKAYKELFALWKSSALVTVQTPWDFFESMAIKNISFTQNAESKEITDISITVKEMRFSETRTVSFDQNQFPVPVAVQESPDENNGIAGEEAQDFASTLFKGYEEGQSLLEGILPE